MTQQEYMEKLTYFFDIYILAEKEVFKKYSYNEDSANVYLGRFFSAVRNLGLSFSDCYHEHGIGNNNQYDIYLKTVDNGGFTVEKKIAQFYFCYGIYGGISVYLTDLNTQKRVGELHYAR